MREISYSIQHQISGLLVAGAGFEPAQVRMDRTFHKNAVIKLRFFQKELFLIAPFHRRTQLNLAYPALFDLFPKSAIDCYRIVIC